MDSSDSDLSDVILDLAARDESLGDGADLLVLAALEGPRALDDAIGVSSGPNPAPPSPEQGACPAETAGAFIRSIRVQGFRGIGPSAELRLQPAPGLTVVAGRNGSGKSSFSEALELALTGDTYRWSSWVKKSTLWSDNWRNLHQGDPAEIRIELAEEERGKTVVGVVWAADAELAGRRTWVQRHGKPRESGLTGLGWRRAVDLYRPFLSYEELGGILQAGPSTLFDKLDAILGVDTINEAHQLLIKKSKELRSSETAAKSLVQQLKSSLAGLDDDRSSRALTLLRKRAPDIEAVLSLAVGSGQQKTGTVGQLRSLAEVSLPTPERIARTAQDVRAAGEEFRRLGMASSDSAARRAELLKQALDFHAHEHGTRCPVCGSGVLDAAWRDRATHELAEQSAEIDHRRKTRHDLDAARSEAERLIEEVPEPMAPSGVELLAVADAHAAWRQWIRLPADAAALADHLNTAYGELAVAFEFLRQEAAVAWQEREDQWTPYAVQLAQWADLAKQARAQESIVSRVEAAAGFAKRALSELRDRALVRVEEEARRIWAALRQESNVGLGSIELKGNGTRRRVEIRADVDGAEAQALGVMSQGELHALALALFLPRATMPGSPFRFVVLDDPIQAMDPAKIDGFVRVLAELARERQVIVLSHDDRLPQAVRQMRVEARVLEVVRAGNSAVTVSPSSDPAQRFVSDARALAKDGQVPDDVRAKVLPQLCRMSVESAAYDLYAAKRLVGGEPRAEMEAGWEKATTTRRRLALALHDDVEATLDRWLSGAAYRRDAFHVVTTGMHGGLRRDPEGAVRDVARLVHDLRGSTP